VWLVRIRPATSITSDASYWDKQLINSTNVVLFVKSLNGGPWILSASDDRNVNLNKDVPVILLTHYYLERASSLYRLVLIATNSQRHRRYGLPGTPAAALS
jgi:hypothetical protein